MSLSVTELKKCLVGESPSLRHDQVRIVTHNPSVMYICIKMNEVDLGKTLELQTWMLNECWLQFHLLSSACESFHCQAPAYVVDGDPWSKGFF